MDEDWACPAHKSLFLPLLIIFNILFYFTEVIFILQTNSLTDTTTFLLINYI